jgi:hypothetical protein
MNAIDLTWLSSVKAFVEVDSTKDDAIIADLITAFSQWVLTYTGRDSLNSGATYTEVYDGNGKHRMFLRNTPIQTLASVIVGSVALPISSGFGKPGVAIDQDRFSITITPGFGTATSYVYPSSNWASQFFWKGLQNVQVVYTAGYNVIRVESGDVETVTNQTVTLAYPTWYSDLGVTYYPSLTPLTRVASGPTTGQYTVSLSGVYGFNAADNNNQVAVSYEFLSPPFDLEFACRRTIGTYYKRRQWLDQGSKALNSGGGSSGTTSYRSWPIAPEDRIVINAYKRVAIV